MAVPDLTSAPTDVVNAQMQKLNKGRQQPLTRSQLKNQAEAKPVYIYNVSTIHRWERFQGQLGTVVIPKCEEGERVSKPYKVAGKIFRWYDKGLGRKEAFEEEGLDVAEDICGSSKEYPVESLNNNLTTFGVFITHALLEDLPKKSRNGSSTARWTSTSRSYAKSSLPPIRCTRAEGISGWALAIFTARG